MTFSRLLLHSLLRRSSSRSTTTLLPSTTTIFTRSLTRNPPFATPEEAAAARRAARRKLRIEPPFHALRRDPSAPRPPRDPNAPRYPDSTSALTGPRLSLHNRVQSTIRGGDLDAATAIARQAFFSNTRPTVFTCNAVLASMYRAGRYDDVVALYQFFFKQNNIVPNIVSYNNLINAHCDVGRVDVALDVYRHILANAIFCPSPVTYRHLTKGLIQANRMSDAIDLLREMLTKGNAADSGVYNNIISGFLELGDLEKANQFFDEFRGRCQAYDGLINSTYMDYYFKRGMEKEALESYHEYLDKKFQMHPATGNLLLDVLLRHGRSVEANALFENMLNWHNTPVFHGLTSETFNIMVNECFRAGKASEAVSVFKRVGTRVGAKTFIMDTAGYTNIVGKFCEYGMVEEAEKLFKEQLQKNSTDVMTFKHMIGAYMKEERIDDVLKAFNQLFFVFDGNEWKPSSLRPNAAFVNSVFGWVVNKGRIEEAGELLVRMIARDQTPDPTTYELVATALWKIGNLDRVQELRGQMDRKRINIIPALQITMNEAFGREGGIGQIAMN